MRKQLVSTVSRSLALVAALVALLVTPALAADPIKVTDHLVDTNSVLSEAERTEALSSIDQAVNEGVNLYVVLTDDFGSRSADDWCVQAGRDSNLGDNAVIYAIATEQRSYAICHGPNPGLNRKAITAAGNQGASTMRGKDIDGPTLLTAIDTAAASLVDAAGAPDGGAGNSDQGGSTSSSSSDNGFWWWPLLLAIVLPNLALVFYTISLRKNRNQRIKRAQAAAAKAVTLEEAGVKLMHADDEVHAAADDLAFARAQFGTIQTEPFEAALNEARSLVSRAFDLQAHAQDAQEGTQAETAAQIVALSDQATGVIESQVNAFNKLRATESNAEASIDDLRTRIAEANGWVARAKSEIESLRLTYSEATLQSILDNPDHAMNLLHAASGTLDEASEVLESDRAEAVHRISLAQRAFGQAMSQLDEVMDASADLSASSERLTEAIASLSSDIEDVDRLASRDRTFGPLVEDAEAAITTAHQARRGTGDPLAALSALRTAEDNLDLALSNLREDDNRRRRTLERIKRKFHETDAQLRRSKSYLASHRGVVSEQAREYLARAEQQRSEAYRLYQEDPQTALTYLDTALENAEEAFKLAYQEVTDATEGGSLSGYLGGGRRGSSIDVGSLVLGGLLFGNDSGWSGGSGSWGSSSSSGSSSSWSSSGGFSGGWSSSGSGSF